MINIRRLLCIVIKLHVVSYKGAKEVLLYFVQDIKVNFDRGRPLYGRISV